MVRKIIFLMAILPSLAFTAIPADGVFTIFKDGNPVPKFGQSDIFLSLEFLNGELAPVVFLSFSDQLTSSPCANEDLIESPEGNRTVSAFVPFTNSVQTAEGEFTVYSNVSVSSSGDFLGLVPGSRSAYLGTINFSDSETAELQMFSVFTYFTGFNTDVGYCLIQDNYELRKET